MDVGVVGAGRVGTAFAVRLARAGHRIVGASGRDGTGERVGRFLPRVPLLSAADVAGAADLAVIAVPDDDIAPLCLDLAGGGAFRGGQAALHLSGSVSLAALEPAGDAGALVLSLHPLQTFPTVEAAVERLPGSAMAVTAWEEEGYELGERLADDVGGRPFRLADERKPLYHAAAVFCSNYLAVVAGLAERLLSLAGMEDPVPTFAPLARATLENVLELGAGAALTGPAVRGDAGTVSRNLEALRTHAPDVLPAYLELARSALELARRAGRLRSDRGNAVQEVLDEWS